MASHRVIFAPEAEAQLVAIYRWIAERSSPTVAERFTGAIVDYCEKLQSFPERGTCRDDLRPGLRTIGFRRRVTLAFAVEAGVVTILGVFYGGQDFDASLPIDED
ncbi:MAG TPA: type II toxin-antitoxin system RelE/ParE family toxin [Methylosinus sp.]|jgi:toxin ParE1/3/4|uniref:type II toxin-antitoxin system RelE/ParE family toxin n=1 Tax=Methylosinus sp. TaxID=427 RepID=UPI002F95D5C2